MLGVKRPGESKKAPEHSQRAAAVLWRQEDRGGLLVGSPARQGAELV